MQEIANRAFGNAGRAAMAVALAREEFFFLFVCVWVASLNSLFHEDPFGEVGFRIRVLYFLRPL